MAQKFATLKDLEEQLVELDAYNHTLPMFTGACLNESYKRLSACQASGGDCASLRDAFAAESSQSRHQRITPCAERVYVATTS
jgi:hypothetical protein